jgi:HTH-type transcriptional repressor of NAD biosynthesis genes
MEQRAISKKGFLLGKFMPLHAGHIHLISTARAMTEQLCVLVCSIESEPIPGRLRYEWVQKLFPDVNVVHVTDEVPQEPQEHPDFWNIWLGIFRKYLPFNPDIVFSSENYGDEIALRMNIKHVPVDLNRKEFPVSGTLIRHNPYKYWEFIPEHVRPYYLKRIVLTGPESTGKTRLAGKLAEYYKTICAEEYARKFWPRLKGRKLAYEDITVIAEGQLDNEEQASLKANKVLVCDTDLIATEVWSEIYFKKCPEWISKASHERQYDLYLLMDIDIPWEDDGTREFPHLREQHFNMIKEELERRSQPYVIISGNFQDRFEKAVKAIDGVFKFVKDV